MSSSNSGRGSASAAVGSGNFFFSAFCAWVRSCCLFVMAGMRGHSVSGRRASVRAVRRSFGGGSGLLGRLVGGFGRLVTGGGVVGGELLVLLADDPGDLDALLDALVQNERDVGNVTTG